MSKQSIPHDAHFAVAGYFYYCGPKCVAFCGGALPEVEQPHFREHLPHLVLSLQKDDGSS